MHRSRCLVALLSVFLSALCPHVAYSINTLCDFGALCSTDEAVNPQPVRLDLPSIEAAKQRCCVEEQAAFYFYSGVGCNPCPLRVETLSASPLTPGNVSLGSASDVVVALRCTVGGPRVRFAIERGVIPPRWLAPTVSYANIDSADNGVIRLEAARVTGDLGLECALNGSGNNRADVTVNFNQVGSLFGSEGLDQELANGGQVTLECPIPDLPDRVVTWFTSTGDELPSNSVSETGLYYCVSTDTRGRFVSNPISVYDQASPASKALSFSTQLPNEVLTDPGSDVRLTCASDGSSDVEWLYNGEVIIGASGNSHTVVNVTQSNSGYYQCRIGGAARGGIVSSSYVHTATVSVSGESCALLGSQHELVCTFEYPVMERDFRWFHNGQLMTSNQSRSGNVSTSRIVIDPVMEANGGEYTCQVHVVDSDSVLNDTFVVTIVDAPSVPQNIRFSKITRTNATVNWDASVDAGNLVIVEYYVQWFTTPEDVREATVNASEDLEYVITGLETFTVYRVQVVANNGKYNSTPAVMNLTSAEDTPVNPPRNLSARPIHANEMQLQWEEPAPPLRGLIVAYIVRYRISGSDNSFDDVTFGAVTSGEVTRLQPGTEYEFYVEAATSAGSGPRVGPVTHTTLTTVLRIGSSIPNLTKALSTTVQVLLPPLQLSTGSFSHFWFVVVRLPCPGSIDGSPDGMFPYSAEFAPYEEHREGEAYIAAEIAAEKLNTQVSTPFVFGDENHEIALMNDVERYRNGPLVAEACYTFFLRGFLSVPMARRAKRKRDVQARQYRTFVSTDFMKPVETLPEESLLQIRFFSVDSCTVWTNVNTGSKIDTLSQIVADVINRVCNCNFNTSDIRASFSCMNPRSDNGEAVVLRMTVREKNGFGAPDAVAAVSAWKDSAPTITIDFVQYTVSALCTTELASISDPDCGPLSTHVSDSMAIIIGSSVSAGLLCVILVLAIVGMVIWMCRRCRLSRADQYETNEREKPEDHEMHSHNGVIISNPPDVDGSLDGLRPKVPGQSASDLPVEGYNYYAPYPPHSASMASLHPSRGGSPFPQPMPLGFRPPPMGMLPNHYFHIHQHSAGSGFETGSVPYASPGHSRQPSDATTTEGRERRVPEYHYYPYQYAYMFPHYHPMFGSPVAPRKTSNIEMDLDAHHDYQSSEYSMHMLRRPHSADLLEREVPRGMSPSMMYPYYHHYPQESDVSHGTSASERPVIHPFLHRHPKVARGYDSAGRLANGAAGEPSDGKASMERFIDSHLEQNRMQRARMEMSGSEGNDIRSDASEASSNLGSKLGSNMTSELGKSIQSIESEVL